MCDVFFTVKDHEFWLYKHNYGFWGYSPEIDMYACDTIGTTADKVGMFSNIKRLKKWCDHLSTQYIIIHSGEVNEI